MYEALAERLRDAKKINSTTSASRYKAWYRGKNEADSQSCSYYEVKWMMCDGGDWVKNDGVLAVIG